MRGHLAFTRTWERPIEPAKEIMEKRGRRRLLSPEQRKQVYEKDLLVRETLADIKAIFDSAGLDAKQAYGQLQYIRRLKG